MHIVVFTVNLYSTCFIIEPTLLKELPAPSAYVWPSTTQDMEMNLMPCKQPRLPLTSFVLRIFLPFAIHENDSSAFLPLLSTSAEKEYHVFVF